MPSPSSPQYRHHQQMPIIPVIIGVAGAVVAGGSLAKAGSVVWGAIFTMAFAGTLIDFTALTITVDSSTLRAGFRFGWPRREIPLDAMKTVAPRRVAWWHGWGLRLVPGGVLYRVWGRDAVEVEYRSGHRTRRLLIGTDDPDGLVDALGRQRPSPGRH